MAPTLAVERTRPSEQRVGLERRPPVDVVRDRAARTRSRRCVTSSQSARSAGAGPGRSRGAAAARGRRCARPPRRCRRRRSGAPAARPQRAADPAQRALGDPRADQVVERVAPGEQLGPATVMPAPPTRCATTRRARYAGWAARRRSCDHGRSTGSAARAGRCSVMPVGQRELHDRAQRLAVLPVQRAGRVGDVVLVAQRAHLDRDLGVAVARQVGEQVVLDLEAEAAAT